MRHLRSALMCARGARAFFKRHNLDYEEFLRDGTAVEDLEATGDAMALRVCEEARRHGR